MPERRQADGNAALVQVRDIDDLWAWMNTWGDLSEKHDNGPSREWREGYKEAISDLLVRLKEMGVENCSDEAWGRFTGRARRSSDAAESEET